MKIDVRHVSHPEAARGFDTDTLRRHFLVTSLFEADEACLTYSHVERFILGGVMPVKAPLTLGTDKALGVKYFLERREMGLVNIGGPGRVVADDRAFDLANRDCLYVAKGTENLILESLDAANPAKFYVTSCPAHARYETMKIAVKDAKALPLGDPAQSNQRTIYQMIHPDVCATAQLALGLTELRPNNMWNTMPCHQHDRRCEMYFYFDLPETARVFHLMGEPEETRHLVLANEQAVISPPWSIHSGVGTSNYSFIWAMAGDNQDFTDMDFVPMERLR